MTTEPRIDLHQRITNQIVDAIRAGAGTYQMPWNPRLCGGSSVSLPYNPVGKYNYRGINILSLWGSQQANLYSTPEWASFRQWLSVGAQVRKGEKGALTVFYKTADASPSEQGNESPPKRGRFIARAAHVFNAAQVDGYEPKLIPPLSDIERSDAADSLIAASGATILHGSHHACYIPSRDEIHLPPAGAFHDPQGYYGIALHELTHWTGHASRCARGLRNRFGTDAYAAEELIAELGAAFLCAEIGVSPEPRMDHARYIDSWLRVLQNDTRAIFTAAAKASQATAYLTGLATTQRSAA